MAKLTLTGLYNYDNSLFQGLILPEGLESDIAINTILMRAGEFELLYPNFDFMKSQIGFWARKHQRTFEKWLDALSIDYDPLYNYDRHEEYSDEEHKGSSYKTEADYNNDKTLDLTDERTPDLNEKTTYDTTDTTEQIDNATSERKVSAYDSSNYEPSEQTETDNGKVEVEKGGTVDLDTTGKDTTTHSGTDKTNIKGTLSDVSGLENNYVTHDAHLYGNIGVTTSQQMLRDELDIQRWNIYDQMADIFVDEFCIQVY